jgi:hypothetical protein
MTEIIDRPILLGSSMGRSQETQDLYEAHARMKQLTGDASCDLCRTANRQDISMKLGHGALEVIQNHITLVENDFPYAVYDGQEVLEHHMIIPKDHYAEAMDFPPETDEEFSKAYKVALKQYKLTFARNPESQGSSIKDHFHMHAMNFGRRVVALSYSLNDGISLVQYRGEDKLHPL